MRIHDLVLPKIDEALEDCEDRIKYVTDASGILRAAVADGATATAFSGQWAELLVHAYCERSFSDWNDFVMRSEIAAKAWASQVHSQDRPWYAIMRAQSGGAAAFAGLEISTNEHKWSAVALGDSCVFYIKNERICVTLPPLEAEQFGDHPRLISTDAAKNVALASAYESSAGKYEPGDKFVLATDAAAEAFLRAADRLGGVGEWLRALCDTKDTARRFIASLRESRAIRDDDVAIVIIEA